MNTSLLTKLAWRILSNPSYLVARVLKARYEKGLGQGNINKATNETFICDSINKGIQHLKKIIVGQLVMGKLLGWGQIHKFLELLIFFLD